MFDMFPRMKYVTGHCGAPLLPKKAIMHDSNLNLQSQQAIFERENTSQNFRTVRGKKKQLDIAWEEHSRKRMHVEAFEKNKTEEDCSIKRLLTWKDGMPYFSESRMFSGLRGAIWQAKPLPSFSSCADAKILLVLVHQYISCIFYKSLARCRTPLNSAAHAAVRAWAAALLPVKRGLGGFYCSAVLS